MPRELVLLVERGERPFGKLCIPTTALCRSCGCPLRVPKASLTLAALLASHGHWGTLSLGASRKTNHIQHHHSIFTQLPSALLPVPKTPF